MGTVRIDARFNGPPDSANGGYACGAFARAAGVPTSATVTLRSPPPLERDLLLVPDGATTRIVDGATLVAVVSPPAAEPLEVPFTATVEEARAASMAYRGFGDHPFTTCVVCGPAHPEGLRIFAGPFGDGVAATWSPDASLIDGGRVAPEAICAALDCPSAWAGLQQIDDVPYVLGRMTFWQEPVEAARAPFAVIGWLAGRDGPRKFHAGTALLTDDGRCLARARNVWVRIA